MHPAIILAFQIWGTLGIIAGVIYGLGKLLKTDVVLSDCRHGDRYEEDEELNWKAHA